MQGGGFRLLRSSGKVLQFGQRQSSTQRNSQDTSWLHRTQAVVTLLARGHHPTGDNAEEQEDVCICVPEFASVNVPVPQGCVCGAG